MRTKTRGPNDTGLRREAPVPGLVSVVVPAHNAARWIPETLASVHGLAYQPIEIVVADDGSTDSTGQLAAASGATVVRVEGAGPGGARNAGLARARGEFIQFLDADDLLAPGKISRQVDLLIESGADVAWEPFHHFVPAGEPNDGFTIGERVVPEVGADLAAALLTTRGFIQLGAMLVRRSARTDAVSFVPGREAVEDVRYTVALAMAGARFVSSESEELGLLFRQHTGPRYSTRPTESFARGCAANAVWAQEYWEQHGGLTPSRRAALSEAYAFAARQLAGVDPAAFEHVATLGTALGPEFLRQLPARVRWLARVLGYKRAEALALRWRRVRRVGARVKSKSSESP